MKTHFTSGLIGAVAMAIVAAGLWYGGYLQLRGADAPSPAAAPAAPAAIPAAAPVAAAAPNAAGGGPEITARLDKIEAAIHTQRPAPSPDPALVNSLAAEQAQTKSLGDSVAALSRRIDDIAGTSQTAAKQAQAAQAAADAAKGASQSAVSKSDVEHDLDPLADRITALERAVAALSENAVRPIAGGANDQPVRLTVAAEALRAAVEKGAPYRTERDGVIALGADRNEAVPLESFATAGIPTAPALAHELSVLIPRLEQASDTASGHESFFGRIEANARHLVRVTPVDAPPGNDPAAVIARLKIDAARADIAASLSDLGALPDATKALAADWMKKAQAREQAIAASRRIAADALAALTKPATQ